MLRGPVEPRRTVYGRCMISGPLVAAFSTGSQHEYLHLVVALAGHEIDAVEAVWLGDEPLPITSGEVASGRFAGYVRINPHLGTSDQAADVDLVAECNPQGWGAEHRLCGIAYLYLRLKFSQDVFPTGIPTVRAVVRGKKLHDPRTGLTAWSDNFALVVRDWITSPDGLACAADEIDDGAFIAAANLSDELVAIPAGGTQTRYTANGTVTLDTRPLDTIKRLLTAGAGALVYTQGVYRLFAGAYSTPTLTLDEDDLRGALKVRPRVARKDLFNGVKGTFADPTKYWQAAEFPVVKSAAYATQDGGEEVIRDLEYPFTTDSFAAQRLARISLEKSRQGITVEFPAKLIGFQVAVWDVVTLSIARMGWSSKPFRVVSWQMSQDGGVDLTLQEESSTSYAWSANDATVIDAAPDTGLPSPTYVATPAGLALYEELYPAPAGIGYQTRVILTCQAGTAFVVGYRFAYRAQGSTNWIALPQSVSPEARIEDVSPGSWEFRCSAVSMLGVASAWSAVLAATIQGVTAPPADVAGMTVALLGDTAHLGWAPVADVDLSHYALRYSPAAPAGWSSAVDLVRADGRATGIAVPAMRGTYLIKAVDLGGRESANATSVVVDGLLGQMNAVAEVLESPMFDGGKTACQVDAGTLRLTPGQTSGQYTFAGSVDLGAVYISRVTADVRAYGETIGSAMADWSALSNVEKLDGADPSLWSVGMEMRVSQDGATWGDWRTLVIGDYQARAFQFRANLEGTVNITPRISHLAVAVDMPDRVAQGQDIACPDSGLAVSYGQGFKTAPALAIAGQNLATGDYVSITAKSATGFTIRFFNAAGQGVSRTFDWIAKGWGYTG